MGTLPTDPCIVEHLKLGQEDCFLCGGALYGIGTYWSGNNGKVIALHADCATRLGCHLICDGARAREQRRKSLVEHSQR